MTGRTTAQLTGPAWVTEKHEFDSLPVLARPGAVIPFGSRSDRPDYEWADDVRLRWFAPSAGQRASVRVPSPSFGDGAEFALHFDGAAATVDLVSGSSSGYTSTVSSCRSRTVTISSSHRACQRS